MNEDTSVTHDSTQTTDRRQRENNNPDRPPIDPDNPDSPDPFDPFETAHMTDGGAIIQDQTELTFESELDAVLPTPETPQTPSASPQTQSPSVTHESEHSPDTDLQKTDGSVEDFNAEPFSTGTLLHCIDAFLDECDLDWSYELTPDSKADGMEHHAVSNGETVFAIRSIANQFHVYHEVNQPRYQSDTSPNTYDEFELAIAAFVEGIDWGTLPPGNGEPYIWEYTGFTASTNTFTEYLSGTSNTDCGDHYFSNTAADYGIHIESYRDTRSKTPDGQTMTIVTLTNHASKGDGEPVYRGRFPGQKHAFDFIFSALANGLSSEISMHNDSIGDTAKTPPIRVLTSDP